MAFSDCMAAMGKALGRNLTDDEAEAFAERLEAERRRLRADGFADDPLAAAGSVAAQIAAEKALAKRQVILNRIAYRSLREFDGQFANKALAVEAKLVGINTPFAGGRLSADAQHQAIFREAAGALIAQLRRLGSEHLDLFLSRDFEIEIAKALRGEVADARATAIAGAIDSVREYLRMRENRAGAWRGRLEGYVNRQTHNARLVERAGFDAWYAAVVDKVDHDKTFGRDRERLGELRAEAAAVADQRAATQAELKDLAEQLRRLRREEKRADSKAGTAETRETKVGAQLAEAQREMGDALERYLDLAQRQRTAQGGEERGFPRAGADERRLARQRLEARMAFERAQRRVNELHDRHSGAKHDAAGKREGADALGEILEAARGLGERGAKGLDLLHELEGKLGDYETRLRHPIADPRAWLREIYDKIVADRWSRPGEPEFSGLHDYIGPANLAKKRSGHRALHFKDAASELAYAREFGQGGLGDNVIQEFEHAARSIALMETFGPNPKAMIERWRNDLKAEGERAGQPKAVRDLDRRRLDWQAAEILGETRAVSRGTVMGVRGDTFAAWMSGIRAVQSMAKLGGAVLSSFGDIVTLARELQYQGKGGLDSYAEAFAGLMRGRRAGQQRIIADLVGVGFDGLIGQVLSRFHSTDSPPGKIAKSLQFFFRLNGLNWWTDAHKTTAALVTSRYFAMYAERAHDALPGQAQRLLKMYGIGADEWALIRTAGLRRDEAGAAFLTPEAIKEIPLGEFYAAATARDAGVVPSERSLVDARDRLATSYQALLVDRAEFAVPTPGARERAVMNMGTERGTTLGEALRFVMQFKSFPVAMLTKTIGRDVHGHGDVSLASAVGRTGWTILQLTAMGYLSMSAKDALKFKNPRDPQAPDTWAAAMLQGGGLGIFGDFVFGEFNRFGRSALATAAGPFFGTADDLLELWAKFRSGDKSAANAVRVAVSNTPYLNLFWARPLLDLFVLWPISESLSPGYLRRMERRVARENKQTYWLSPSEAVR